MLNTTINTRWGVFGFARVPLFLPYSEGRVSCCPAAESNSTAECLCLLPKQWPLSCCWEGGGGGVLGRLFQPSNFFIKRGTAVFLPLLLATTTFALKPRRGACLYFLPLLQLPSCFLFPPFFLTSQACPTKTASPFFLSAAPSRLDLAARICFLRPVTDFGTPCGFDNPGLFAVYVDSIIIISWSKRKVGPVVYVTELGTLESATAPWQTVPMHFVCSFGSDITMNLKIRLPRKLQHERAIS